MAIQRAKLPGLLYSGHGVPYIGTSAEFDVLVELSGLLLAILAEDAFLFSRNNGFDCLDPLAAIMDPGVSNTIVFPSGRGSIPQASCGSTNTKAVAVLTLLLHGHGISHET